MKPPPMATRPLLTRRIHQPGGDGRQAQLGVNNRKDHVEPVVVGVMERVAYDHACGCNPLAAFFHRNSYPTGKGVNAQHLAKDSHPLPF
jgi:hypothetical protein